MKNTMSDRNRTLRGLPSVEKILQALPPRALPRPLITDEVRKEIAALRKETDIPPIEAIIARVIARIDKRLCSALQPVINGTGVVIHTNLGRAPLAEPAIDAMVEVARRYNNLEFDLNTGKRGSRGVEIENRIALLCGAEASTVVNNCASALVLILRHFTAGDKKEVIISRGELVQIGGGFRIPDILETSGAVLREVGTTNRTSLADYENAIGPQTALILKVHRSNFYMDGFVDSAVPEELTALAKKKRIPLVEDLGSGAMVDTGKIPGVAHEPTPSEVRRSGVDVCCFSGDKLLGGPQAGLIIGKKRHIRGIKKNPFFRALRCDKLILAALAATVDLYIEGLQKGQQEKLSALPHLRIMNTTVEQLTERAENIMRRISDEISVKIIQTSSKVGGGTLPRAAIPSVGLSFKPRNGSAQDLATVMRDWETPIIGYINGKNFVVDLRTVFPTEDETLAAALNALLGSNHA